MNTLATGTDFINNLIQNIEGVSGTFGPAIRFIVAIIIFLIGKSLAGLIKKIVEKSLLKTDIDNKLAGLIGANSASTEKAIASFVYAILLLMVAILALNIAQLTMLLDPLKGLLDTFLSAIPKLVKAGVVIYLGTVLAKIVKGLVQNVLSVAKIDQRLGNADDKSPIAEAIATALYCFILLLIAPVALGALEMPEISQPIAGITEQILGAIPNILTAGILIAVGVVIGQIAQKLITNLLNATGINDFPAKMGLSIPTEGKNSLSGIAGLVVFISILVFLISIALTTLGIKELSAVSEIILGGYYNVLLAVLIFGAGFIGAKFAYSQLADKNLVLAKIVNGLIIFVTSVVALDRSGLAPEITGLPFNVIVIALGFAAGVGGAIAIGLGAKDFISRFLEKKG